MNREPALFAPYQQVTHRLGVNPAAGECLVEAAVTAAEVWFQAQRRYRTHRRRRTQRGVGELERGVGPAGQAPVEARPEAS